METSKFRYSLLDKLISIRDNNIWHKINELIGNIDLEKTEIKTTDAQKQMLMNSENDIRNGNTINDDDLNEEENKCLNTYIVLPDLDKKIDEALYDAINFFEKKCPYCDYLLFTGHIRNKIHLDHFIPIAKGGQHVPWNILPVCQKCNSKKNSKRPKIFLSDEKYLKCAKYLISVQTRHVGQVQIDLEKYARIKSLFVDGESILKTKKTNLTKPIYEIISDKQYEEDIEETSNDLETFIISYFDKVSRDQRYLKSSLLEELRKEVIDKYGMNKSFSSNSFNRLLKKYCQSKGLYFNPHVKQGKYDKRNGKEYYTIATKK